MHDGGAQLAKELEQLRVYPQCMTRRFLEGDELDVITDNAFAKIGDLGEGDDDVPIRIVRHVVDQIDDSVFQPANIKAVHDMGDKRTRVLPRHHRFSRVRFSAFEIAGSAALTKSSSTTAPCSLGA